MYENGFLLKTSMRTIHDNNVKPNTLTKKRIAFIKVFGTMNDVSSLSQTSKTIKCVQ